MPNKQDSNATGLRFADEASPKVLIGSPIWYPLEPNGYNDFGGNLTTLARTPISAGRQRQKGVVTDLDAAGGFSTDLTQSGLSRLLQGFVFADWREKKTTAPMNAAATAISSVTSGSKTYAGVSGLASFLANHLVLASNFSASTNNGVKTVTSSTSGTVVVNETVATEASPPAAAKLQVVGYQFASATVNVAVVGTYPRLSRISGSFDFTTLGLVVGEWMFIGGDSAPVRFVDANNTCFARVRTVGTDFIEFDKTSKTMVVEAGTGLTVRVFFGNVLRNEADPTLIKRRTYQMERTLGKNDSAETISEYLTGAVPNQLTLNVEQADKVTADLSFVAMDHELRNGPTGVKAGTRPAIVQSSAFNTSSDFSRIKMHQVSTSPNPNALFAFFNSITLTVNNSATPLKAVGVLGAFDVNVGNFEVSGSTSAYFADIASVQAVRNNADVTLDFALVKNNAGMVFDLALLSLGNGRLQVEPDQPIQLDLSTDAAEGPNGYTLLISELPYLPAAADL